MTDLAVKFADGSDSIIEGLAIPYGGILPGGKDLAGEKFGPTTDLALDWFPSEGRPFLYHHGLDDTVKAASAGRQIEREERDIGQWVKVQLDKRGRYVDAIRHLVDEGALSFSSGAMPHLVKTRKDGFIERWPWVELSGTPTPAEPGASIYAVKSVDAIEHLTAVKASAALVALLDASTGEPEDAGSESFDDQAARVASVVGEFVKRADARIEVRAAKAGRELSASNRTWLQSLDERLAAVTDLRAEVKQALSRTDPDAKKAVSALEVELLLSDLRRAGLTL